MHILIPALHRPSKPTGVCRHAVNLAQCLVDSDTVTQVTLLIGEWQQDYFATAFHLTSPKIKLLPVAIANSSRSRNLWFLFGLPQLAKQLQPDIIHLSFPFPFIRGWFSVPVVATIHDLYPYECPENFGYPQVWFNRWFLHQCVQQSDGLSCVSHVTLNALKQYFPTVTTHKKTTVVYNYVDFNAVNFNAVDVGVDEPTPPSQIAAELPFPFILSVAQHRKNKNLDLLIQAYALLLQQGQLDPATQLLLVGSSGPETDALITLIQSLSLQNQVRMMAAIADRELCWLYQHCTLFVIPSATEGFCLPLVEALSFGCRVVCSEIPIFREVGSAACYYFKFSHRSVQPLAEAMTTALNSPAEHHPHPATSDLRFTKDTCTHNLLEFYNSVTLG